MDAKTSARTAELAHFGLISVTGPDARAFLHAQLTNDIANLPATHARYAGWCSAKGRLLASFLVVPHGEGFLLQLSRDLAAAVAKRLAMFVLRAKVRIADASDEWRQFGMFGVHAAAEELEVAAADGRVMVRIAPDRILALLPATAAPQFACDANAEEWTLAEIRAGRPLVTLATQDQFVPQMLNLELTGGVDFHKGCYPGQEIVARAQYRGQLKRRMMRVRTHAPLHAGQELHAGEQAVGTVVNAAGDEALAVLPIAGGEGAALREVREGAPLEALPLPYQA